MLHASTYLYVLVCTCTHWQKFVQVKRGTDQHILVCTCVYHILVHTRTYQYVLVCRSWTQQVLVAVRTGMYWYVPVCTSIYWYILVCTGTYQHVLHIFPTHKSCWNIGIQTGTYQDVHSGTLSYCLVSSCPLLDTWRYKAVQGSEIGTMRYMAVPESPVPLDMQVQGGT